MSVSPFEPFNTPSNCFWKRFLFYPPSVWPDLAKFRHFGNILQMFCQLFEGLISMWQTFKPTLENSLCFWAYLHCQLLSTHSRRLVTLSTFHLCSQCRSQCHQNHSAYSLHSLNLHVTQYIDIRRITLSKVIIKHVAVKMDFKQYASAKGTSYSGCSRDGPIAALGTHEL